MTSGVDLPSAYSFKLLFLKCLLLNLLFLDTLVWAQNNAETHTLTVVSTAGGTVISTDEKIQCGDTCSADYPVDTEVSLTAQAEADYTFQGWSEACQGNQVNTTVTLDADKTCSAQFIESNNGDQLPPQVTLTVTVKGPGKVSGNKIDCGESCQATYEEGTTVSLTALPNNNAQFNGWGGNCSGSQTVTTVTLNNQQNCSAQFVQQLPLTVIDTEIDEEVEADIAGDNKPTIDGLAGANAVTTSMDGRHVYAVGLKDNAVVVFNQDTENGLLTFAQVMKNQDIDQKGLGGAADIVVSPDDQHVYVASILDDAVVVFTRDLTTGLLTLVEVQQNGINNLQGLTGASALAMSPDGSYVYVSSREDNVLTVFRRNSQTGVLTHLKSVSDNLSDPRGIAVSQQGTLYVTSHGNNTVVVFTQAAEGNLQLVSVHRENDPGIGDKITDGLEGAYDISLSPDNQHAYVVSDSDNALTAWQRDPSSGQLTFLDSYRNGENQIQGLSGARSVVVHPNGEEVYVAGNDNSTLVVFARNAQTGLLTFKNVIEANPNTVTEYLSGISDITLSPQGDYLYATALQSNALTAFKTVATVISNVDLAITMAADKATITPNNPLTYTLTVTNKGTQAATQVRLTNTLPTGVTLSALPANCTQGTGNILTCDLTALNPNEQKTLNLTVTTTRTSGTLTAQATIISQQQDQNANDNSATQTTPIESSSQPNNPTIDLAVVDVVASPDTTVNVDDTVSYTITVTNQGNTIASGVQLTAQLPTEVTYVSNTANCTPSNGTVTCTLGSLAPHVLQKITITAQANTPGEQLAATFSLTGTGNDSNNTNNNKTVAINITGPVTGVNVTLAEDPDPVLVDNVVTYTLTVTNQGQQATAINLTVNLSGVTYTLGQVSGATCTPTGNTLTCNLGSITAGNSTVITLPLTPQQIGTLTLTAEATSAANETHSLTETTKVVDTS
ncbi:MAG: beta-propeller fold lactonase family protein, partial [Pseudomonadota bacterium]|nr:beta-propeller fold lactonase family protein [Pseudomonadota bacterium]